MFKIFTVFLTCFVFVNFSYSQLNSSGHKIIDNLPKYSNEFHSSKRSVQKPTKCNKDTVEYGRYKGSAFFVVSISKGRSLGQLYSTPKPLILSGFSFYAFVSNNPPSSKKMRIICNVYRAGADSLPKGLPLRSDTIVIDSTFAGGVLTKIEKHATFKPLFIDSAYIITVGSDSANLTAAIVTNSYSAGDGKKENLNCGSISGQWYNGKNLNIGGIAFNADILLHPHVSYNFGTDFTIKSQCYNVSDTVKFTNQANYNMVGSRMYNRYLLYGLGYYCNWWQTDAVNSFGYTYSVDHKIKYAQKQNYLVRLISTVYGYRGMQYGCMDTTEKWLYYKPDFPQVSGPSSACKGDNVSFVVTNPDTGAVYEWYKRISDPLPFYKGKVYAINSLAKSDTFFLRSNNHGCVSLFRNIVLSMSAYPTVLTFKNDSVCSGSKANLKGFTDVGKIEWFTSPTSPAVLWSGSVYQTPVLSSDTFFYIHANNKGCIKGPRIKVSALVDPSFAPNSPLLSKDTTICLSATPNLTLNATAGSGLTIRWFDVSSGGSNIATGSSYNFATSKREVKVFYADAWNGVCGSTREPVEVTVEDYPKVSTVTNGFICKGDSLIMKVAIPFGNADWYDASSGGNLLYSGIRYASLAQTTSDYFVETSNGVCINMTRTLVKGTVNNFPTVIALWGDTICAKNKATLKSKLTGPGTIHWFEYDTSTIELGKGVTFKTATLNGSKSFYGQPEYAGCYGSKQLVAPSVKPIPFSGFNYEVLANQSVKVSPINSAGSSVLWSFGDGTTSVAPAVTHLYVNPGVYKLKLTLTSNANGCVDSTIYSINVLVNDIKTLSKLPSIAIYPNPTKGPLNIDLLQQDGTVKIAVYSMDGQMLLNTHQILVNNHILLDIGPLRTGVYLLKLEGYQPMLFVRE